MVEKVVFLDIHGVLETRRSPSHEVFDVEAVAELKRVCDATNAKVVLTSNLRVGRSLTELQSWLCPLGIPLIGVTPTIPYSDRREEILEFVEDAPYTMRMQISTYVIFDDDDIGLPNALQTSYDTGITPTLADQAIQILKGGETRG